MKSVLECKLSRWKGHPPQYEYAGYSYGNGGQSQSRVWKGHPPQYEMLDTTSETEVKVKVRRRLAQLSLRTLSNQNQLAIGQDGAGMKFYL